MTSRRRRRRLFSTGDASASTECSPDIWHRGAAACATSLGRRAQAAPSPSFGCARHCGPGTPIRPRAPFPEAGPSSKDDTSCGGDAHAENVAATLVERSQAEPCVRDAGGEWAVGMAKNGGSGYAMRCRPASQSARTDRTCRTASSRHRRHTGSRIHRLYPPDLPQEAAAARRTWRCWLHHCLNPTRSLPRQARTISSHQSARERR